MSEIAKYVQQTFRLVAVLGGVAALVGVGALTAAGLTVAGSAGVAVPAAVSLSQERAQQFVVYGAVGLFGGLVLNLVANTVASFAAGFRDAPGHPGDGVSEPSEGASRPSDDAGTSTVPVSERYLAKLRRTYLWLAGFVALLTVLALAGGTLTARAGSFSALDVLFAIAVVGVELFFGGVAGAVGTLAVLLALWYGTVRAASEALVAGFVVALLFVPTAALLGSFGLVLFALAMLYYNFFARGATEFRWIRDDEIPGPVRRFVE